MRIMGLDVGSKTIGVAVSDPLGWTAQGIETIRRKNKEQDFLRIGQLIEEYEVERIVVGLPKNMNGTIGVKGEEILEFVEDLKKEFQVEVDLWDERLTTVAAEKSLIKADVRREKRKKVIDKLAAVLILQGYLDYLN
ncbi:MAG TPA: Holliday junction resolvase RuvX [Clostridia bacterium]|nr:Holliday junction resolvase RuvX [Clostridia bacterium]